MTQFLNNVTEWKTKEKLLQNRFIPTLVMEWKMTIMTQQPCQLPYHSVKADSCDKKLSADSKIILINSVRLEKV